MQVSLTLVFLKKKKQTNKKKNQKNKRLEEKEENLHF